MADRRLPYHQVVLTAGISVFAARNIFGSWAREVGLFTFAGTAPQPTEGLDLEACLTSWDERCRQVELGLALRQPADVSAEVSLLHALQRRGRLGPAPTVTLIVTDTFAGRAAVTLVRRCIERMFDGPVGCRFVSDIAIDEPERLRRSLGAMMGEVARALEGGHPSITCFAPVGGYKVITSLGYLVGAYLGFPTAYLHEDNQILHEIPAVPVRVSPSDIAPALPLMCRSRYAALLLDALPVQERSALDAFGFLFEQGEGLADLSAFGRFLADRPEFRPYMLPRILATPEAVDVVAGPHGAFVARQLDTLVDKLAHPTGHWGELHHEASFGLKNVFYALYKGSGDGTPVFRAAYRYNEEDARLLVRYIWTDHPAYTREVRAGKGFFDPPESLQWEDISAEIWPVASSP